MGSPERDNYRPLLGWMCVGRVRVIFFKPAYKSIASTLFSIVQVKKDYQSTNQKVRDKENISKIFADFYISI